MAKYTDDNLARAVNAYIRCLNKDELLTMAFHTLYEYYRCHPDSEKALSFIDSMLIEEN